MVQISLRSAGGKVVSLGLALGSMEPPMSPLSSSSSCCYVATVYSKTILPREHFAGWSKN